MKSFKAKKAKHLKGEKSLKNVRTSPSKKNLLERYNDLETHNHPQNALIKTLVDALAGVMVGPVVSATLGKFAPLAGLALTFGGHYTGDRSGLLRGIGMITLAHSVAKAKTYRQEDSTLKDRLSELKDDWLRLVFLKKESGLSGLSEEECVTQNQESFRATIPVLEDLPAEASIPQKESPRFDWDKWLKTESELRLI